MIGLFTGRWRWAASVAGAAGLLIGALWYLDHRGYARAAGRCQATVERLQLAVRARTAEARIADLERARAIEAGRTRISQEASHDYQKRLAAVRARHDRLRAASGGAAGCAGGAALSGISDPAGGPDAAAAPAGLPCSAALIATEQAMQLEALQGWLREQQEVSQ